MAERTGLSTYGVTVLVEAGACFDLVKPEADGWRLTKTGYFILEDEMTRVNMNFVQDVNYQGIFNLEDSIKDARPAGLSVFGDWPTVYEGLSKLPPKVQESWFGFDHYYSDAAFPEALPVVFGMNPKHILDVGGNTGKWTKMCTAHDQDVRVTILDLPGQLEKAKANLDEAGVLDRVELVGMNLLDHERPFPTGRDLVWMSQFLCCFPESDVVELLRRGKDAVADGGAVCVLETFWDRQPHPVAALTLCACSLYFTAIANGTSRIYDSATMKRCVAAAGLSVEKEVDDLAIGHTLLICRKA